ncbi:MauE/DoxX family redox-associated membrane protein [Streptomyces sp. TLI_171]|uniref:DoxX family protein n=1 Tax=Streptomyces sp. TLI_171 TaxID=1938859 RepID=UPI000C19C767|nr:MauE/DoxX family redox-associated membrane protein [Streptomyces sp. TLI_171]RKE23044.1 putative membrane protein [Streptomyces sp. TLI_171]
MTAERSARLLGGLLLAAGVAHFAAPRPFDAIVPRSLPGTPRTWTRASGVAELAVGAAVLHPRSRRAGALAAAGLFTAVFPANVKMAYDWRHRPAPLRAAAVARLPLQVPLIAWALRVSRG